MARKLGQIIAQRIAKLSKNFAKELERATLLSMNLFLIKDNFY